jgi:hypothetical protein
MAVHKWITVTVYTELCCWMLLSPPVMNYYDRSVGQPNTCSKATGGFKLTHNRAAQICRTVLTNSQLIAWVTQCLIERHGSWLKKSCNTTQFTYTSQLALEPRLNTERPVEQRNYTLHMGAVDRINWLITVGVRAAVEYRKTYRTTQLHTSQGRCGPNQLID